MSITVSPAYGRDYTSADAARKDWAAGKDFVEGMSGKLINKDQTEGLTVNIRYNRLRRITGVPLL